MIAELLAPPRRMRDYRLVRPNVAGDVSGVSRWLRHHGWADLGQGARDDAARRLLFLVFLCAHGAVTDWPVTEDMLARAAAIPSGRGRKGGA